MTEKSYSGPNPSGEYYPTQHVNLLGRNSLPENLYLILAQMRVNIIFGWGTSLHPEWGLSTVVPVVEEILSVFILVVSWHEISGGSCGEV